MSAAVDSGELYASKNGSISSDPRSPGCSALSSKLNAVCSENGHAATNSQLSPQTPTNRVGFSLESDSSVFESKEQERYLTAKYPKHQMGLIRKRLAVEDWVDAQLKLLFNISDEDYETYDTMIDLDELLNLDTAPQRSEYIQQKIAHAPKSPTALSEFTDELLQKANTL